MNPARNIIVATALLAWPMVCAASQEVSGCKVEAEPSRRIELPDSRVVSTDVKSVAQSNGVVMAVGSLAYVFPAGALTRAEDLMRDSIMGFTIDTTGVVSIVPNPPGVRRAFFPRIAAAQEGSFHVIYVTTEEAKDGLAPVSDTASLWYARFQQGRWSRSERLIAARGAHLDDESTSALVQRDGQLSFLFPLATTEAKGLVLLRRLAGAWRFDTLRTTEQPTSVAAAYAVDGTLVVAFTMSGRALDPSFTELLFATRFDTTWSVPARIAGDGRRPVTIPRLLRVGGTVAASWIAWTCCDAATSQLQWLQPYSGNTAGTVSSGDRAYPYEALVLDDRYPLWLIRGPQYGTTVSPVIGSGTIAEALGPLSVPFENPKASAVLLEDSRVLVLTMKQGRAPDEPMVASYATVLQFRCPESAQRE